MVGDPGRIILWRIVFLQIRVRLARIQKLDKSIDLGARLPSKITKNRGILLRLQLADGAAGENAGLGSLHRDRGKTAPLCALEGGSDERVADQLGKRYIGGSLGHGLNLQGSG
jgi:hypothetical protein